MCATLQHTRAIYASSVFRQKDVPEYLRGSVSRVSTHTHTHTHTHN